MNNSTKPAGRTELAQKKQSAMADRKVSFNVNGVPVELSPSMVRNYLVSGDKEKVSMQELVMFINLCKGANLNPWLREAYCIKYGSEPATMVVGRSAFEKRADACPAYDGMKSGVIVIDADGEIQYRDGGFKLPDEQLVGGWAEVFRKDRTVSHRNEVSFYEYNTGRSIWKTKPCSMIRKVAVVQALRESFPNSFTGMYDASEMGVDDNVLDMTPVDPDQPAPVQEQEAPKADPATGEVIDEEQVSLNDL